MLRVCIRVMTRTACSKLTAQIRQQGCNQVDHEVTSQFAETAEGLV